MAKKKAKEELVGAREADYDGLVTRISNLLEQGRRATVRTTNAILTATYWEVGRQIVEYEQGGKARAVYGEELMKRLSRDLTVRFGRGFGKSNLFQMRGFYLGWEIFQTPSGKLQARVKCPQLPTESGAQIQQTVSAESQLLVTTQLPLDPTASLLDTFPLYWSHYLRLMSVEDDFARWFYEDEAIQVVGDRVDFRPEIHAVPDYSRVLRERRFLNHFDPICNKVRPAMASPAQAPAFAGEMSAEQLCG